MSDDFLPSGLPGLGARIKAARDRLARLRGARKVTQEDLGDLIGVGGALIGHWETGRQKPDLEMVERLARALRVAPGWLYPGVGSIAALNADETDAQFEARTGLTPRARAVTSRPETDAELTARTGIAFRTPRPIGELLDEQKKPAAKRSGRKRAGGEKRRGAS